MVLAREPAIGLLDVLGRGGAGNAQKLIVIPVFHQRCSLGGKVEEW
jgi:hypothetical protein